MGSATSSDASRRARRTQYLSECARRAERVLAIEGVALQIYEQRIGDMVTEAQRGTLTMRRVVETWRTLLADRAKLAVIELGVVVGRDLSSQADEPRSSKRARRTRKA